MSSLGPSHVSVSDFLTLWRGASFSELTLEELTAHNAEIMQIRPHAQTAAEREALNEHALRIAGLLSARVANREVSLAQARAFDPEYDAKTQHLELEACTSGQFQAHLVDRVRRSIAEALARSSVQAENVTVTVDSNDPTKFYFVHRMRVDNTHPGDAGPEGLTT